MSTSLQNSERLSLRTKRIKKMREHANEVFHVDQLLDQYPLEDEED